MKKFLLVSITAVMLSACGGGDSESSGDSGSNSYPKPTTPTVNGGECQTSDNGNVVWGVAGGSCTFKDYPIRSDFLTMSCTTDGKITVNSHGLDTNTDGSYKRTFSGVYNSDGKGTMVSYHKTAVCPTN